MEKNLANLGTALSRNEAKKVVGGKNQLICVCGGNSNQTTACSYDSQNGFASCTTLAANYCLSQGFSSMSCGFGPGPQ